MPRAKEKQKVVIAATSDDMLARLIELPLTRQGYRVFVADSEERLLELAREHGADLAVVDADLPGLDRDTLEARLRDNQGMARTSVRMLQDAPMSWPRS